MLYPRWQRIADTYHDHVALREASSGKAWTFGELARLAEADADLPVEGGIQFPQGPGLDFVLTVLRAWRAGRMVCPLEPGQARPTVEGEVSGLAHLKMTSATTGAARLVGFTAAQIAADAENIVTTMGLRPEWPNIGIISLAHSYGFSNLITPLLLHGIPLILANSPLPESMRQAAALASRITLPAVPALWRAWHEAQAIPHNIQVAISAGAPLPLALEQAVFSSSGLKLHNFYGATECGGIAYDATDRPRGEATCVGTALAGVSLGVNPSGCLEVRGAAVGQGYLPESQSSLRAGCFATSDLAEIISGEVHLRGRLSDQINVAGRKLSPETIERALLHHPAVSDALVFGAPSTEAERSEMVVACVVVNPPVAAEALKQHLLGLVPAWQVPREWRFVASLAPNNRGKLSRPEWRARLGFSPPPQPASTSGL